MTGNKWSLYLHSICTNTHHRLFGKLLWCKNVLTLSVEYYSNTTPSKINLGPTVCECAWQTLPNSDVSRSGRTGGEHTNASQCASPPLQSCRRRSGCVCSVRASLILWIGQISNSDFFQNSQGIFLKRVGCVTWNSSDLKGDLYTDLNHLLTSAWTAQGHYQCL